MAKLTQDQWEEVRRLWAAGTKTKVITELYGISRTILSKKIRSGAWAKEAGDLLERRTRAQIEGLQSAEGENSENVNPGMSSNTFITFMEDRQRLLVYHRLSWVRLEQIRSDALDILEGKPSKALMGYKVDKETGDLVLDEKGKPIEHTLHLDQRQRITVANQMLSAYRKAVDSLMLAQEGQRRAHGFDFKMMQEDANTGDAERRQIEIVDGMIKAIDSVNRRAEQTLMIEKKIESTMRELQGGTDASE